MCERTEAVKRDRSNKCVHDGAVLLQWFLASRPESLVAPTSISVPDGFEGGPCTIWASENPAASTKPESASMFGTYQLP